MTDLFDPLKIGDITVANRIAMAPLTRNRADPDRVPTPLMATYYAQRATAGLIVSEATQISPLGQGYLDTPGIYNAAQIAAWRDITAEVHERGGKMVLQLWHVGRISHVSLLPAGEVPVSSTARAATTMTYTASGFTQVSPPRALRADELPGIVADYVQAARNAIAAGFDGVEVHSANGYLLDQFLRDSVNDRTDAYGGSIANRARFPLEVMRAVAASIGPGRTGIRISPVTPSNDAKPDSNPQALFDHLVTELATIGIAYVHVVEGATGGARDIAPFDYAALRARFRRGHPAGAWIANNGYDAAMARAALASGAADLVAFGKPFISNPDLVARLRTGAPLAAWNQATFYGGGATGYTDYPALA